MYFFFTYIAKNHSKFCICLFLSEFLYVQAHCNQTSLITCSSLFAGSTFTVPSNVKGKQLQHGKYLYTPVLYYGKSSSTFHVELLVSGDINPNPGPESLSKNTLEKPVGISYTREHLLSLKPCYHGTSLLCTSACNLSPEVLNHIQNLRIFPKLRQRNRPTHR